MKVVQFNNVWEMYRVKFSEEGKTYWDDFWPLKDISFAIEEGEAVGIIGPNGSGKSTILKLIAGMLKPDKGEAIVQGKVSGLLELGAGFEHEMTGRENIYNISALYGLSRSQTEDKFREIANFADIGRFINAPVKCYSQGMFVRLAFAIAINMDTNILLIDDTLSVGDEYFQRKCIKKIFELKDQGKTIVFVTHDMNMLRRLCKRGILIREGQIIKDSSIDEITPLYTQAIGKKEGVGFLKKDKRSLVFNNGRLFINFEDKLLTSISGIYTAFLVDGNKWYNSLQADWELEKVSERRLIARGDYYQLSVTQVLYLEIADDDSIKLDIEIESDLPIKIQEACTNFMLSSDYIEWFTALENGKFPPIDDNSRNWQPLLDGNSRGKCMGVASNNVNLPNLAIEQNDSINLVQSQIFNTDFISNCRVLQYKALNLYGYSANQAGSFVYFSGKIVMGVRDIKQYLETLQDKFILVSDKFKLIFNDGRCVIFYNNEPLTEAKHITIALRANGKFYFSDLAHWEIKKEGDNKIVANGMWRNLPIRYILEIESSAQSEFFCKLKLHVDEEVNIEEHIFEFMCRQDYLYWFSDYMNGVFPLDFTDSEIDMAQRCISDGAINLQSANEKLPVISLNVSKGLGNFTKIFNSDFRYKSRIIRLEKVEPEQDIKLLPGDYEVFNVNIASNNNKKAYVEDLMPVIRGNKLKFIFNNGSGRIYWDDQELTKRLGMYTSLRSVGHWYDSRHYAAWKVHVKDKSVIKASGKWLYLPISQSWEINMIEDRCIEFNITMEVEKEIAVDRLQTNIMFSERYQQWVANKVEGAFSYFKGNIDDDWEVLHSSVVNGNSDFIGLGKYKYDGTFLPKVIFVPDNNIYRDNQKPPFLNILNSDLYHRGRILQYLKKGQEIILPGEYSYYKGRIEIEGFIE